MKRTLLLLSCLLVVQTHVDSAELAKDGATRWKIVLPDAPTLVEKTAARELAEHLKLVTGADFPTLAEREVPAAGTSLMFVGQTAKAPRKDYKFDEILIQLDGGNLIFAGHPRRGCLYAVYSFLQDVVGVRWWTPADTFIPQRPTLVVADELNVSYAPQMISREMYHRLAQPTVFSARMKGNGFLTPEYGGAVRIIHFVHSFYKYLPPDKYFAAHPDWYSEIDGKRKHEQAQLCLTNDEMTQELIQNVLESLRKDPEAKIIDVSQNDWHGFCTCAKCKAIDDAEESHAGTLLVMLNKVAAAVEQEFPDVLVESLAYQYTRQPPQTIKPRDNVLIRLCTIERIYLGCFGVNSAKWIDLTTLNRVTEFMNKAVQTATRVYGADSDELRRLRKSKLGVDHVWLSRYYPLRCEAREKKQPFLGPQDPVAASEEFAQLCRQFKTQAAVISQEQNFGLYLAGLKAGFLAQRNPPEICQGVPEDAWVVFDALSFNNVNNAATIVDDPAGWNGKSVRMGTKVDWNTSYTPPVRGKYRVLASLRCEGTRKQGRLGSWGVYDVQGKKGLKSMPLAPQEFATADGSFDKKFRWIDLGAIDFVPGAYIWFAHGHSPELDAIFVDRVVLIAAE